MLGLLSLGITAIMIYTLVKNALLGKQLSKDDSFLGTMELIIPVTSESEFFLHEWKVILNPRLKVHVLIDGHHPSLNAWQDLKNQYPFLEVHTFSLRPDSEEAVTWMISQIAPRIESQMVIIGDPELVPSEYAFSAACHYVQEKNEPYYVLPQTAKIGTLGETFESLNPTLAYASFFGPKKWRKNISHPLLSISKGWLVMPLQDFKNLNLNNPLQKNWKELIVGAWDEQKKSISLAFGEKHLVRHYSQEMKHIADTQKQLWMKMWGKKINRVLLSLS